MVPAGHLAADLDAGSFLHLAVIVANARALLEQDQLIEPHGLEGVRTGNAVGAEAFVRLPFLERGFGVGSEFAIDRDAQFCLQSTA